MKRFFFHAAGAATLHDISGGLLADAKAVRLQAERHWRQLQRHHPTDAVVIVVADESGKALLEGTGERVEGRQKGERNGRPRSFYLTIKGSRSTRVATDQKNVHAVRVPRRYGGSTW